MSNSPLGQVAHEYWGMSQLFHPVPGGRGQGEGVFPHSASASLVGGLGLRLLDWGISRGNPHGVDVRRDGLITSSERSAYLVGFQRFCPFRDKTSSL